MLTYEDRPQPLRMFLRTPLHRAVLSPFGRVVIALSKLPKGPVALYAGLLSTVFGWLTVLPPGGEIWISMDKVKPGGNSGHPKSTSEATAVDCPRMANCVASWSERNHSDALH